METTSAEEVSATENGRMVGGELSPAGESAASSKRKGNPAKAKPAGAKARKTAREQRQSARTAAKGEKLVCRYCGSDDLSPSFKKRRDARCRACFKKRYSTPRGKKTKRARVAKAAD